MAQYIYSFYAYPSDTVPHDDSSFYLPGGNVSVAISNARSDVSDWRLGLVLQNVNTLNTTDPHSVTPSNPSTVFTGMIAGNYRLLMRSVSEWVAGTVTITTG